MPLGEEFLIIAFFFGLLIGCVSSIVGLGGGILVIPCCIFIFKFPPEAAIVISLFYMTCITISASIRYMKMGLVNYRLAMLYNLFDIPGVIIGGLLTLIIIENILAGISGFIIIFLSIMLFRKKEHIHKNKIRSEDTTIHQKSDSIILNLGIDNLYLASFSSFSGGVITGLVGLGGGTTDTTSMILLGLNVKKAAATSEFAMASTSFFGIIMHLLIGSYTFSWLWPFIMAIGGIIGAQIGPILGNKVKSSFIRKGLAGIAFYTGILMILLMLDVI
ncbi:MAG: sulfite exporter TauE/SafE family protein [Candidatus Lokiarchaeota archaeon]|nr:sulfite exporter TauE/SafE family protein [Candidatus Lokiarchaeota archaeon]